MIFNSLEFFIFLPIAFALYWLMKGVRSQNLMMLISSYIFYAWWDWRFLVLIIISSLTDYYLGLEMGKKKEKKDRKLLLFASIGVNLGILGFFKYFNFFISSFIAAFDLLGIQMSVFTLRIILPVGISYYTFQTLSYTIDIYRGRMSPVKDWVTFFTFVAFFPQLVAGPIERSKRIMPYFQRLRKFNYEQASEGMKFILYGLFKKIVIADYCGERANEIFENYTAYGGSDLFIGLILFYAIQLYADFSAYSEIAIGTAKLFGVNLSRNFAYPYFAKNIEEFWQRWHITLTTWFRDYVFVSLRRSPIRSFGYPALVTINFVLIGLWHGANYTFILWGFLNGLLFIGFQNLKKRGILKVRYGKSQLRDLPQIILTLIILAMTLVLFRSPSITDAFNYLSIIFSPSLFSVPTVLPYLFWSFFLLVWEWIFRDHWHGLALDHLRTWQRWSIYIVMIFITMHHFGQENEFIYFQF